MKPSASTQARATTPGKPSCTHPRRLSGATAPTPTNTYAPCWSPPTGYEYCSIHELLDCYTHLLQKTGSAGWGDRAEWLLFNAGQGARHPEHHAIAI